MSCRFEANDSARILRHEHSPEIPPAKCYALGWRKILCVKKLINESDCDRN
jgi:hypothetical protein